MNCQIGKVYRLCYKGKKQIKDAKSLMLRTVDTVIRITTWGKYSHCELGIYLGNGIFDCYSSSYRDGGVRNKQIAIKLKNWDVKESKLTAKDLKERFKKYLGHDYDLWGAIGVVIRKIKQNSSKEFCSELCFNIEYNSTEGWQYSPTRYAKLQ